MLTASLLLLVSGAAQTMPLAPCRAMATAKAAGDVVLPGDTVPVPCPDSPPTASLRYDAGAKVVKAQRDLAVGDMLGHVYIPARPAIIPGDRVMLTARIGHVTIARPAHALQAADGGHRYFVRLDDGSIVTAPAVAAGGSE